MNPVRTEFQYGDHQVVLEANRVARQATGSVLASMGDTVVLCSAVVVPEARPDQGFFPLTVNYEEKMYAAGKIPGGFPRREGRPTEKETLTCRLIDRPIRPLFPKGFMNEVQVICTVMSAAPATVSARGVRPSRRPAQLALPEGRCESTEGLNASAQGRTLPFCQTAPNITAS